MAKSKRGKGTTKTANKDAAPNDSGAAFQLPMFYRRPIPITPERHGNVRIDTAPNFAFASGEGCIPLTLREFAQAQNFYPVVFSNDPSPAPVAITGIARNKNLFVMADGRWLSGAYVPAYVRRYPFIFAGEPGQSEFRLCVDEADSRLNEDTGEQLFDDNGKPTALTDSIVDFCKSYHEAHERTRVFCDAIAAANLLEPGGVEIKSGNDKRHTIGGFQVISEKALSEVPDEIFIDWRKRGWIGAIYAHLLSFQNWHSVAAMATGGAT